MQHFSDLGRCKEVPVGLEDPAHHLEAALDDVEVVHVVGLEHSQDEAQHLSVVLSHAVDRPVDDVGDDLKAPMHQVVVGGIHERQDLSHYGLYHLGA